VLALVLIPEDGSGNWSHLEVSLKLDKGPSSWLLAAFFSCSLVILGGLCIVLGVASLLFS